MNYKFRVSRSSFIVSFICGRFPETKNSLRWQANILTGLMRIIKKRVIGKKRW